MPNEKIHALGNPGDMPVPYVSIAWGADMDYVQVASQFDAKQGADIILEMVNEWLKAAGLDAIPGREELDRLIKEKSGPESIAGQFGIGFDGFHITLGDRRSVNRLIELGKRSRDGAFGKDQ